MKKQMTKQSGITLIALVITIIILLILSGVSISMLVGDNGVLNKAKNAKQNTQRAEVIEQARLDVSDKQVNNLDSKLKKSELIEVLNEYFENVPENSDDILSETVIAKQEYGGYSIKVSEIYNNGFLDEVAAIPPEPNPPEIETIKIPADYKIICEVYTNGCKDGYTAAQVIHGNVGDVLRASDIADPVVTYYKNGVGYLYSFVDEGLWYELTNDEGEGRLILRYERTN